MAETMDRIIDKWTEENGGRMDKDDLVEMVEYIESIEWYCMASMMHGYFWGAATDNEYEQIGEQLRNCDSEVDWLEIESNQAETLYFNS